MTDPRVHVYVARCADYDDGETTRAKLAFTSKAQAKQAIEDWDTDPISADEAEWETVAPGLERKEDKIGNWAEIEHVRIADPVQLFADTSADT